MNDQAPVEVELALAYAGSYRAKGAFDRIVGVSLGHSESAVLRLEEASLPACHEFLQLGSGGARLLLTDAMALELIYEDERKELETLKDEGLLFVEEGMNVVSLPLGANAVLTLGELSILLKCREAKDPATYLHSAGTEQLVCGRCGTDLKLVVEHPLALSICARCKARNWTRPRSTGSLGPDGTDADVPLTTLVSSFESVDALSEDLYGGAETALRSAEDVEKDSAPAVQELSVDEKSDAEQLAGPDDFEEEATHPSVSLRGSDLQRSEEQRAERKVLLQRGAENLGEPEASGENASASESGSAPRRRRRRGKSSVSPLWTPRLISLAAVGLISGAIGVALIFYAVFVG